MVSANCGYQGAPQGRKLLIYYGPNMWVDVGFDPQYTEGSKTPPAPGISRIEALIDTGAEEGCIDSSVATLLKLPVVDRRPVGGIHGVREVDMHLAQVHIPALRFTLHGAFAGVNLREGGHRYSVLIGRTFLSHFRMQYDGPEGAVTISSAD